VTPSASPELSSKVAFLEQSNPGKNPHRTLKSTKFIHEPPYFDSFSPPSPPTPPPLPQRNSSKSNSFKKSSKSFLDANAKFSPFLSDIESCCSSDCSHLSGSVPVMTKVISFSPGPQPMTHAQLKDQIDHYNYSLDSLIPQIQQKPHMTEKFIPYQTDNKQQSSVNINRDDLQKQEREKLNPLFKEMDSLSKQRSSIIKELLVGHEHDGCVMKSEPVQSELKKLLNKSMKLRNKHTKKQHITMEERFRNWVTANKKDERLVITPDSDIKTDDNYSVTSIERPRTRSDKHKTINNRHFSFRQSANVPRHNSFKQNISGQKNTSRRQDFGRNSLRELSLRNSEGRNNPILSRGQSLRFSSRSYKRNKNLKEKFNENIIPSAVDNFSDLMSSDSSFGYSKIHSHDHMNRPMSKLERVKKAWQEDDYYFVNPRDPWRLLYEDSHSHHPTFRNPSNVQEIADEIEFSNSRKRERYTNEPIPIRQRIRESWQQEEPPPPLHPSYNELNMQSFHHSPYPPLFDHLLPNTSDLIFRAAPPHTPVYLPSPAPAPLDPTNPEASPLVLGWLQVPESAASAGTNTANTTFRKAPWLNNLHFLRR